MKNFCKFSIASFYDFFSVDEINNKDGSLTNVKSKIFLCLKKLCQECVVISHNWTFDDADFYKSLYKFCIFIHIIYCIEIYLHLSVCVSMCMSVSWLKIFLIQAHKKP